MGVRPLLVACAAFLAGSYFGFSLPFWTVLLALPIALWRPGRFAAVGFACGVLRAASQERPAPFDLPEEFEGRVVAPAAKRRASMRSSMPPWPGMSVVSGPAVFAIMSIAEDFKRGFLAVPGAPGAVYGFLGNAGRGA